MQPNPNPRPTNLLAYLPPPTRPEVPAHLLAAFQVPDEIHQALLGGASVGWSLSGGKDSVALAFIGSAWFRAQGYPGRQYLIHADLGRAEWKETPAYVEYIAERLGLSLIVERRVKGDLVERITSEAKRVAPGKRFWPSSRARYCTSDMKRGPIQKAQRRLGEVVICCQGLRAAESKERATRKPLELDKYLTALSLKGLSIAEAMQARKPRQRVAINWLPIFNYTEAQVWEAMGSSLADIEARRQQWRQGYYHLALANFPGHPAYVLGNKRLSCALCVLGCKGDLLNGAEQHPALYADFIELEIITGDTFLNGWSLTELPVTGEAARLRDEVLAKYNQPTPELC